MSYTPTGLKKYYHQGKRLLAKTWLSLFHPIQIGITGSQGKTTTTEIVTRVLSEFGPTVRTDVNLDTTFNVPITALHVRPGTKFIVWELGIDHPGEMDQHHEIARPTISSVTSISPVHTDEEHMGSLETLIQEKQRIIEHLPAGGVAVLNHDNEFTRQMGSHTKAHVKWFGTTPECTIWVDKKTIKLTTHGTVATCYLNEGNTSRSIEVTTGFLGGFHLMNITNAYLLCQAALPDQDITNVFQHVLKDLKPLRGRMSIEEGPLDTILLNDSLRANPESTRAGLEALDQMEHEGRKIAVIGEMGELEKPEEEHRKTGEQIAKLNIDYFVCIGPLRKHTIDEARKNGVPENKLLYAKDVFEAADILKDLLKKGDLWYLKGSLLRNYNRILKLLSGEEVCCSAVLCPYEHCGYKE